MLLISLECKQIGTLGRTRARFMPGLGSIMRICLIEISYYEKFLRSFRQKINMDPRKIQRIRIVFKQWHLKIL